MVTLAQTLNGEILPFQLIYKGKTARLLPLVQFPTGFCSSYNPKHWINDEETIRSLVEVIQPYLCIVKEELGLPIEQKSLILWDAFRARGTNKYFGS